MVSHSRRRIRMPFVDDNLDSAIDTYAIQSKIDSPNQRPQLKRQMLAGTALEISHLITFLPSYLFPDSLSLRSPVSTWICAGASLGGHVTWLAGGKGTPRPIPPLSPADTRTHPQTPA